MMATDQVGKGTQIERDEREAHAEAKTGKQPQCNTGAAQGKKHSRKGKTGFKAWDCLIVTSLT